MPRLAAALLLLLPGCAATGDYLHDRGADLVDVVRGHLVVGRAVGAEVQATQWLALGFLYEDDAWAAGLHHRALGAWRESIESWGLVIHDWRETTRGIPAVSGSYGWYQHGHSAGPAFTGAGDVLDRLTLRASAALLVGLDLELRLGEVVDLVGGIFTWDPARDD